VRIHHPATATKRPVGQYAQSYNFQQWDNGTATLRAPALLVSLLPVTSFPRDNLRHFTHEGKSKFWGLRIAVTECMTYQPRDKTVESGRCAAHYHNLMPNTSKHQRDDYFQSI